MQRSASTRQIQPLLIEVVTRDNSNPDHVTRKVIAGRNSSDRKWLSNHASWAWNNNHSVLTVAKTN